MLFPQSGAITKQFLVLLAFSARVSIVFATCYYPNGDTTNGDIPCSDSSAESTCCGIGYACLSNNICMRNANTVDANSKNTYVRGSCTDKTFRSSSCPSFCVDPKINNVGGGDGMAKCAGVGKLDMYYCIDANVGKVNCTTQNNVIVFAGTPSVITTIGVAASSSTTTTKPSTSSAASSPTSATSGATTTTTPIGTVGSQTSSISSPTETITPTKKSSVVPIAVGVAVPVVFILATLAGFLFWRRKKASKAETEQMLLATRAIKPDGTPPYEYYQGGKTPPAELGHEALIGELGPGDVRHEMDGGNYTPGHTAQR